VKIYYLLSLLLFCAYSAVAQDIHWSQFNDNPIFQNPANSGRFTGDYRIHGNYRDQWRSVTVPFSTFSFSGDTKFAKIPKLGLGALFFHDQAGDGKFKTIELQISPSYQMNLTNDSVHTLSAGLQIGMNHRQVNMDKFSFDAQFDGTIYNPNLPTNEIFQNQKNTNFSIGTGLVYEWFKGERKRISGGLALFNLNKPNQGFFGQTVQRDMRLNLFAKGQFELNYDWDLLPTFQLNFQGKYKEIILGSSARYILIDRLGEYRAVYFGAFYRNKDAGYLSAGMDYQNWFAGLSYDINFSKLTPASNVRGGIELSVRYIITRFNPKKVLHRVCPDYI
jgi:type IX secretion system PorP/SprF family membrane protein